MFYVCTTSIVYSYLINDLIENPKTTSKLHELPTHRERQESKATSQLRLLKILFKQDGLWTCLTLCRLYTCTHCVIAIKSLSGKVFRKENEEGSCIVLVFSTFYIRFLKGNMLSLSVCPNVPLSLENCRYPIVILVRILPHEMNRLYLITLDR